MLKGIRVMEIDPEVQDWYVRTRRRQGLSLGLGSQAAQEVADLLTRAANSVR